jgi:MFS family permease
MTTTEAPSRPSRAAAWRSGPLGQPAFRLLTVGQLTSTVGDYCYAVALPWLVLSGGGSAASLGIVLACYGVPRALLTLAGGSLVDRFGPRRVMLASDAGRCVLTVAFVVLAAGHVSSLAALAPVAAALGAAAALFLPASMTIMPGLVEESQLTSANAVYSGLVEIGSLLGPVLGGVLVATAGPAPAFAVDAGSFLVSAVSIALIGRTAADGAVAPATAGAADAGAVDAGGPGADAAAGPSAPGIADGEPGPAGASGESLTSAGQRPETLWSLLRRSPLLPVILVVSVTANFAVGGTTEVALPALAHARFGAGGYGAVLASFAAAGIIGALLMARIGDRYRPAVLLTVSFLVGAAGLAAAPYLGGLPGLAAGLAVFGLAVGLSNVVSVTLIQRWAPPAMLGRVWGLLVLASTGSFPVSTFAGGLLTRHLGPSPVFLVAGVLLAASIVYGVSRREFRDFGAGRAG